VHNLTVWLGTQGEAALRVETLSAKRHHFQSVTMGLLKPHKPSDYPSFLLYLLDEVGESDAR